LATIASWADRATEEWHALIEQDHAATPAHHPRAWQALSAALPAYRIRVVEVREDGRLLGGAPCAIETRLGLTWLHAMPFLLPGAPLALAGRGAEVDDAVAGALAEVQQRRALVGGEWSGYRPEGAAMAASALDRLAGETRVMETAVIDLDTSEREMLGRMDRKTRQDIVRSATRGVRCDADPASLERIYALHARQARGWGRHRPLPLELSRRMLAAGAGQVLVAHDRDGVLCGIFALDGPHETFLWWSGSHPSARANDAYPRLMAWAAEWARSRGRRRLNLGASRGLPALESFKRSMGARSVRYPVRWLEPRSAAPLGRLAAELQRRMRRGRHRGTPE
jgi:GNAT superfamily N-acetyltransferase